MRSVGLPEAVLRSDAGGHRTRVHVVVRPGMAGGAAAGKGRLKLAAALLLAACVVSVMAIQVS